MNIHSEKTIRHEDVEENVELTLVRHADTENGEKLLASFISPGSATRYQFSVTGNDTCVYERTANSGLPPIETLSAVRECGWKVENLPEISDEQPVWKQLDNLSSILQTVKKHHGDIDPFVPLNLQRAINVIPVALVVHVTKSLTTPEEYQEALEEAIQQTDGILPTGEPEGTDVEPIQMLAVNLRKSLPRERQEEIVEFAGEHNVFNE